MPILFLPVTSEERAVSLLRVDSDDIVAVSHSQARNRDAREWRYTVYTCEATEDEDTCQQIELPRSYYELGSKLWQWAKQEFAEAGPFTEQQMTRYASWPWCPYVDGAIQKYGEVYFLEETADRYAIEISSDEDQERVVVAYVGDIALGAIHWGSVIMKLFAEAHGEKLRPSAPIV